MDVVEFFESIRYGELRNNSIVKNYTNAKSANDVRSAEQAVLNFVNTGILEIYKELMLKVSSEIVESHGTHIATVSDPSYMLTAKVLNSITEKELTPKLVHDTDDWDFYEMVQGTFQFNPKRHIQSATIVYYCTPKRLYKMTDVIPLRDVMLPALADYLAYKASTPMDSDASKQQNQTIQAQKWTASINALKELGYGNTPFIGINIAKDGWV